VVYHDVTERKWAQKGIDGGAQGLIAVNNRAGGHAGGLSKEQLFDDLSDMNVPLVCAGGIGSEDEFIEALSLGYSACQLGTRFIATKECASAESYKNAIVNAGESDIVLSERITGVPVSLIQTPYVKRIGIKAGPFARWMLNGNKTKHWMRMFYTLRSAFQLRSASMSDEPSSATKQKAESKNTQEFWQAGKSVQGIKAIESVATVVRRFEDALNRIKQP
jgi:nitronate monooxygenase